MKNVIILLLASTALSACGVAVVDTGKRGVKTHYGKVVGESLAEGLYFYNPLTSDIIEMDTRVKREDGETSVYTKDVQQSTISYAINYSLAKDKAHIVFELVGQDWAKTLIGPAIAGNLKSEIGTWEAVDLIANRQKAAQNIEERLRASLAPRGINIESFQIVNIDYSDEFEQAVEAKVTAIQKAEQAKNQTVQIEEQAKQKVIAAKAEAESMEIRSRALSANTALIQYEAVQKWNGVLPQYVLGENAMPFINIGK